MFNLPMFRPSACCNSDATLKNCKYFEYLIRLLWWGISPQPLYCHRTSKCKLKTSMPWVQFKHCLNFESCKTTCSTDNTATGIKLITVWRKTVLTVFTVKWITSMWFEATKSWFRIHHRDSVTDYNKSVGTSLNHYISLHKDMPWTLQRNQDFNRSVINKLLY